MNVGFIGTGSMGSILVEAFIQSKGIKPENLLLYNRTPSKAEKLAERYPGIKVSDKLSSLAEEGDLLFICVRPQDYKGVLETIAPILRPDHIVISITSTILIEELENVLPRAKVIKMIPSITNAALTGALLVMFGSRIQKEEKKNWFSFFSHIGTPILIEEKNVRAASDITSCGPAFFSFLLQDFIQNAVRETGIDEELAARLASEMIIGLSALLSKGIFTLPTLQARVCVPGGVTGAGLYVLEKETRGVFRDLFLTTHAKFRQDREESKTWLPTPLTPPDDSPR
ncbi:late competence protein ComER [Thermicanus aegyptius]|uniref:late competence protein ComER n=1 Tax=Thermicanus aegyptius TaxID=94009 RepID=UPI00041A3459|nr:late competence protein ComER [Thermicanus aegyptius]